MPGLLQTAECARALFDVRRPSLSEADTHRFVDARMARQAIFERTPLVALTFVVEEVTLRRPIGGRTVLRSQLERLVQMARLRHVEIQVMPTEVQDHAGMGGELQVVKLSDGTAVGHVFGQLTAHAVSRPHEVRILELRYGILRSQALSPWESLTFIEKARDET